MRCFSTLVVVLSCAFSPLVSSAATVVTDDITQDTEWTLAGSPYVVSVDADAYTPHSVRVVPGVTLTIDPGVVVKYGVFNGMSVEGTLSVQGTAENGVIFTSLQDDAAAGDTNADGTATTPSDYAWMHLDFLPGSVGELRYFSVRYGGAHATLIPTTGIANYGGTLTMDHATLTHNGYDGLGQYAGDTSVTNATIADHMVGITMMGGTLSVSNSSIHNNTLAGINNESGSPVSALHNWWGSASGPHDPIDNPDGNGDEISGKSGVVYTPWLTSDPALPQISNVLFLPGIEGSRLYEGTGCGKDTEEKLWDPVDDSGLRVIGGAGDLKVRQLFLDATGKSVCSDIYTKDGDIIDTIRGNNFYAAFVATLTDIKNGGVINDWKSVAYDWRLSLPDLLVNGTERDGKIYYEEASSTPYIEQTLRALARSSKSGKVTIIAHSNGGLVTKALLDKLGDESSSLVDRVIFVGVPESGTPEGLGALLFGYDQSIPSGVFGVNVVNADVARALAQNSPMAYHLLPSEEYLESTATDPVHPVIRFSGRAYTKEENAYGPRIATRGALKEFLTAHEGGREKPRESDVNSAEILNASLIDYGTAEHATIDPWTPPAGIHVDQIAGWGVDTIAGIDFYTSLFAGRRLFKPIIVEDGDGVVTTPSALLIAPSSQVSRYWFDLHTYNKLNNTQRSHKDIFESRQILDLIINKIQDSPTPLPDLISTSRPEALIDDRKLIYILHSPLTIQVTDSSGRVTGLAPDGTVTESIPGSSYGVLGEVKYVVVPEGETYTLAMHGLATGVFTLDIDESVGGSLVTTSSIEDVPTTESTTATLTVSGGPESATPLVVDSDGDGNADVTIPLSVGGVVAYDPPVAPVQPSIPSQSAGSGGGAISIPVVPTAVPANVVVATSTAATTTPAVITSTKKIEPKRRVARAAATAAPKPVHVATHTAANDAVSQQSTLQMLGAAVYNGWHGFWSSIKWIF